MTGAVTAARRASRLRHLELLVLRKLDGIVTGDHQSAARGTGSEAGDARAYEPGDDARRIDWNLTARSGSTMVRDTVADRELEMWLVVDASASMEFGTAQCEKREVGVAAAAAFGFLTARPGNRLGAVVFDGRQARIVPPRSGREGVFAVLTTIERQRGAEAGGVTLAAALRRCRLVARRRGVVVVVSDLLDGSDWRRELAALAARHEVIVAEITDPREDELPPVGLLTLVDPETGRRVEVQTSNRRLRERFDAAAAERRAAHRRAVRSAGAAHLVLSTSGDWLADVVRFTRARRRRR